MDNMKYSNNKSDYINYTFNGSVCTIRKSYHIKYERQDQRQIIDNQILASVKAATVKYSQCINCYVWIINHINNTSVCVYIEQNKNDINGFFIHATTVLNKVDIFTKKGDIKITINKN